jgi:peptidyl-prolyl cis-trans isomerase C
MAAGARFRWVIVPVAYILSGGLPGLPAEPAAGQAQAKKTPPPAQAAKPAQKGAEEAIPPAGPNALFPSVVARVNGRPVLGRDLEQRVRGELATLGNPAWKDLREDYRNQLVSQYLTQLVGDELLYQKATASGISASQAEIQKEFESVAKTYPDDAALNRMLAERGLDRKGLLRELGKNLAVQKYVEANISRKIVVTPDEVAKYYQSHPDEFKHPNLIRSSHIMINVPQGATADQEERARQLAASLLARARKGEDFAKLAKENSMDSSASRGGDLGLTGDGELAPEYEAAASKMKVGEISGLVRTQFGYHIIKLTEKKPAGTATLEEIRGQLVDYLKGQKEDDELNKLLQTLQGQAKIEILIKST